MARPRPKKSYAHQERTPEGRAARAAAHEAEQKRELRLSLRIAQRARKLFHGVTSVKPRLSGDAVGVVVPAADWQALVEVMDAWDAFVAEIRDAAATERALRSISNIRSTTRNRRS